MEQSKRLRRGPDGELIRGASKDRYEGLDGGRGRRRRRPRAPGSGLVHDGSDGCARAGERVGSVRGLGELPTLAVTGNVDAGVHALRAGADSIVPKPISAEEVRLRIWRLLQRSGHVREVLGDSLVELDRRNHLVLAGGRPVDL